LYIEKGSLDFQRNRADLYYEETGDRIAGINEERKVDGKGRKGGREQ